MLKVQGGSLNINREVRKQITQETEDYPVLEFDVDPARIRIEKGVTLNMGNYESAKVAVTIEVPCRVEDIPNRISELSNQVEQILDEEICKARGEVPVSAVAPKGGKVVELTDLLNTKV